MHSTQRTNKSGFVLIETIVAATLLIIAVGAVSNAFSLTFDGYRTAQQNYTAAKIAQEGIELVINKRDNHLSCISNNEDCPINQWHQNLKGEWLVDATEPEQLFPGNKFDTYSSNSDHVICRVTSPPEHLGKYGYCSEETGERIQGNYNRKVTVSPAGGGGGLNKLRVESRVTWGDGREYTLEEVLFESQ